MNLDESEMFPILTQFTAPWCGPCRAMKPLVKDLVAKNAHRMAFQEIDIDISPDIAEAMNVRAIPTLMMLKRVDGQWVEMARSVGGKNAAALDVFVESALSTETI